jgi:uncharacterized cupin superfamily protein
MSFTLIHRDDCETAGNWTLVRRTLDLKSFGVNLVDLAPGEQIPEHDETERDQEELFYIVSEDHRARAGTFARLDPEHRRTVRNDGEGPATVLIVSAPRSSRYTPMEWA